MVNIVTCPIGTDCGGSAPVVGLYGQQRAFCPTGNYCTVRVRKCRFECHINCMHSHSYNVQCGTMKTSEFTTTQVELAINYVLAYIPIASPRLLYIC